MSGQFAPSDRSPRFVPGLSTLDTMLPTKVELTSTFGVPSGIAADLSEGARTRVSKVRSSASPVNTKDVDQALAALDRTVFNAQRVDLPKGTIGSGQEVGNAWQWACSAAPDLHPYSMLHMQLPMLQQQMLFEEWRRLFYATSVEAARSYFGEAGPPEVPAFPDEILAMSAERPVLTRRAFGRRQDGCAAPEESCAAVAEVPGLTRKPCGDHVNTVAPTRGTQTLSTSLHLLSSEDPEGIFIVRRINKLGFKAIRTLKGYFSTYGPVKNVLLAHSTVRQYAGQASQARRRPSSLGFVQMFTADAVRRVLECGSEQEIGGFTIRVQRFQRQQSPEAFGEEEQCDIGSGGQWVRNVSETSTAAGSSSCSRAKATSSDSDNDKDLEYR
mmetsp:Transcript_11686/g.31457  ORF Transcript_11686/g.31457 Transcript_11686/m.31457 type:complete len:385 (-) Transcript_11686:123-1277(-)